MNVELELFVTNSVDDGVDPDRLAAHLDEVMDALVAQGAVDPDISATLSDGSVVVSVVAEADTFDGVVSIATGQIRAAIHGAGGSTEGWPSNHEWQAAIVGGTQRVISDSEPALA